MNETGTMRLERHIFGGVPIALLYAGPLEAARARGTLLCFHGLGSSKEEWLHDLTQVAECGFVDVGFDSYGHGERRDLAFTRTYDQAQPTFWPNFVSAIQETSAEVPRLIDDLTQRGLTDPDRVGAIGVSMGGFIVYSALRLEPRLKAVVTLVSSPQWWGLEHPDSPHRHFEAFSRVRLLSLTAGRDEVVPNRFTYALHDRLRAHFSDYESRMAHHVYPASDHHLNPDWHEALRWLALHLG